MFYVLYPFVIYLLTTGAQTSTSAFPTNQFNINEGEASTDEFYNN
jgi:hypothetical protein